jgi:hypothetical protein
MLAFTTIAALSIVQLGAANEFSPCPANFDSIDGECFSVSVDKLNWLDGMRYCESINGQLATFPCGNRSKLVSLYYGNTGKSDLWIGYHQIPRLGQYRGVDGSVDFCENWQKDHPDNRDVAQNCALIGSSGQWKSGSCGSKKRALCRLLPAIMKIPERKFML